MSQTLYPHRLSVSLTEAMDEKLETLAVQRSRQGQPHSKSDLIREALRLYLDEQPDLRGSRRQLAKSLEGQLEQVQAEVMELRAQLAELQEGQRQMLAGLRIVVGQVRGKSGGS